MTRPVAVAPGVAIAVALAIVMTLSACSASDQAEPIPGGAATTTPQSDQAEPASIAYDLQGHRGARGLRPENTLPAFETALDLMVTTLEFDLHLSSDDVVIVWHDPVIDSDKCIIEAPAVVRELTAAELTEIRCDQNPDRGRFPDQAPEPGEIAGDDYTIASLDDVFAFVESYAISPDKTEPQRANAASVNFNIETKRKPDDPSAIGDGFDGESVGAFEMAVLASVRKAGLADRVTVQSFDHRSLWAIERERSGVSLAALTRRGDIPSFEELDRRGAAIWSPDYRSVSEATLQQAQALGLQVIPWTINSSADIAELLALGVDGVITDRPDLAPAG